LYRIAVCDDEILMAQQNASAIRELLCVESLVENKDYSIDIYTDPSELLERLHDNGDYYHLLLLDVNLEENIEGTNGIELGKMLRDSRVNCSLIYITAYRDYVFDSFDTRPLQYLLKPVDKSKLKEALLYDYYNCYESARLVLRLGSRKVPVPVEDIYYLESTQHKVAVYKKDSVIYWNGSLASLDQKLPKEKFCRCHNSYIVNLSHVTELVRYEAHLDNGKAVPVSKQNYNRSIDQYIDYMKI
jgi:DNA-binding LytR/AlgR family response regulator